MLYTKRERYEKTYRKTTKFINMSVVKVRLPTFFTSYMPSRKIFLIVRETWNL